MTAHMLITNGPSKFDFFLALMDRKPGLDCRKVVFTDKNGTEYTSGIRSIGAQDRSGESWNMEGYVDVKAVGGKGGDGKVHSVLRSFTGQYCTDTRKGFITFE